MTMDLALHLAAAEVYDRIQYELGPEPWTGQPDADDDPGPRWRPASAWVAVMPLDDEHAQAAAAWDHPWLWARGLVLDHDAIRQREKDEEEREAALRAEALSYTLCDVLDAHTAELARLPDISERGDGTEARVARVRDDLGDIGTVMPVGNAIAALWGGLYRDELHMLACLVMGSAIGKWPKHELASAVVCHVQERLDGDS